MEIQSYLWYKFYHYLYLYRCSVWTIITNGIRGVSRQWKWPSIIAVVQCCLCLFVQSCDWSGGHQQVSSAISMMLIESFQLSTTIQVCIYCVCVCCLIYCMLIITPTFNKQAKCTIILLGSSDIPVTSEVSSSCSTQRRTWSELEGTWHSGQFHGRQLEDGGFNVTQ